MLEDTSLKWRFSAWIKGSAHTNYFTLDTNLTPVEYHQSVIDNTRAAEKAQPGRPVAIALDTKGPEIRTGNTKGDVDLPLSAGTILNITTDDQYATACDTKNM